MVLQLRQIEIGAAAAIQQFTSIVKEIEAEVEEAGGDRCPVEEEVLLFQMPAPRANHQRREFVSQLIRFPVRTAVLEGPSDRVHTIHLARDDVGPRRRESI